MRYAQKHQREDTKNLLRAVFEAGGILTLAFVLPGAAPTLIKAYYERQKIKEEKLRKTLYRMRKSGLISIAEDGDGKLTLKLEHKGKEKAIKYQLDELVIEKPERWDGLWRIVVFDIPDEHKYARNLLREKLQELRFVEVQRSIYAHPYPCEDVIELIRSVYQIRQYVKIILANSIEHDTKILSKFGLSRSAN